MPLVTLTICKPKPVAFKSKVLDAVHAALIEILWSVGRSVKVKRKLLTELMALLAESGLNPEHVMVVFKETSWENWAFGGRRVIHG